MDILCLPVVVVENIFSYLSYDEIAKNRLVSKSFNEICSRMLNRGFMMIERRHAMALKNVKAQLPRRESERRYHHLSRHCDILTSIETRISMLNMTYSKFIDNGLCCFIPGKVIDEIRRVLSIVETSTTPPRAHEVLQELRDISSMAIEHFDDKISPEFRKRLQDGVAQPAPRPSHGDTQIAEWLQDQNSIETITKMLDKMVSRTTITDELEMIRYFKDLGVRVANSEDEEDQYLALDVCRKWVTSRTTEPPFKQMMAAGLLPVLIQCLSQKDSPIIQKNALLTITNLTCDDECVSHIVAADLLPVFIKLLDTELRLQAIYAMGNIVVTESMYRDLVLDTGIIKILMALITPDESIEILQRISWFFRNLCGEDTPLPEETTLELLSALKVLITHNDKEILLFTLTAINSFIDEDNQIKQVVDSGIVPELLPLLVHKRSKIRLKTLNIVSLIMIGTDEQKRAILNCGDICNCASNLSQQKGHICKYVAWVLSSITPKSSIQIKVVIQAALFVKDQIVAKTENEFCGNAVTVILGELLKTAVNTSDEDLQETAMEYFRTFLLPHIMDDPPLDELIADGIIPILVECLNRSESHILQQKAAYILSDIARGTSEQTNEVVVAGAISTLIELLTGHKKVHASALFALANISADKSEFRSSAIELGAFKPLSDLITQYQPEDMMFYDNTDDPVFIRRHTIWFIWVLCTRKFEDSSCLPIESVPDILKTLEAFITYVDDIDILLSIVEILYNLCLVQKSEVILEMFIDSGIVIRLIPKLSEAEYFVQLLLVKVVFKLMASSVITDEQKESLLNDDALNIFLTLMYNGDIDIYGDISCCLSNLTSNERQVQSLIDAGVLPFISYLLNRENDSKQLLAVYLMSKMCNNLTEKQLTEIEKLQITSALCNFLNSEDPEMITYLLNALRKIIKLSSVSALQLAQILIMNVANAATDLDQEVAVQRCRQLLCPDSDPPLDKMISAGILPSLLHCLLNTKNDAVKFDIICIFTNITAGTYSQKREVINAGIVPILIDTLGSQHHDIREKACWSLGNLIGDEPKIRELVIEAGVVKPIISFLNKDTSVHFLPHVVKVIINLCRSKKSPPPDETVKEILQAFNNFIIEAQPEIITDMLKAIIFLCYGGNHQIDLIIKSGLVQKMVTLLLHYVLTVQSQCIVALGHIMESSEKNAQYVVDCDVLSYFPALILHDDNQISTDAVGIISTVTKFGKQLIQSVIIKAGLSPYIVHAVSNGVYEKKKWAAFAVTNVCCYGTKSQIMPLIKCDVLPPYCDLLVHEEDSDLMCWVLDGLIKIVEKVGGEIPFVVKTVEECGGLEKIKALRSHTHEDVAESAVHLIRRNFFEHHIIEQTPNDDEDSCCMT